MKAIVDSILPLKELDMRAVSNLEKLSVGLGKFGNAIKDVGRLSLEDFKDNVERMVSSMALQLELVNAMANGGKVGSGYFDIGGTDFKKGFLDPNLKID